MMSISDTNVVMILCNCNMNTDISDYGSYSNYKTDVSLDYFKVYSTLLQNQKVRYFIVVNYLYLLL